ncbi:hypothetical protein BDB00DRAFT_803636 [Zychaea mexicana]|uniref:uncharacterized protein n=1 Tax=Zychaea mexicana TaxID=64656 RepID=UPI0022FE24A9|nr:uncharacterized protein BDB00DRAFT_803636 [Zychaea mexicana]KAI9497691.1 hypothetical protein BDB00DRAFT_803636 [Zychaea mexicana]
MSASVAGPSRPPTQVRDWLLPLPVELSANDSFSTDLIRQFDKKRSRLRVELKLESNETASSSSSPSLPSHPSPSPPTAGAPATTRVAETAPPSISSRTTTGTDRGAGGSKRRRSAGDLLRRSSAFLRAKIEALRGTSRSHDNLQRNYHDMEDDDDERRHSIPPPSKIVVNTTIAIPQFNTTATQQPTTNHHGNRLLSPVAASIQPPVITQYPPKPLKYSPVEPVVLEESTKKSLHHRISMPVLRNHNGRSTSTEPRRRSDVGVERMGSIGKRARKALGSCAELKSRGVTRKGKERAAGSPASTTSSSSSSAPAAIITATETSTSAILMPPPPPPPPPSALLPSSAKA